MNRYIDDIAEDRSASYKKKYILSRLKYILRRIFNRRYEKKINKALEKYEQIY